MGFFNQVEAVDRIALSLLGGETITYRPQFGTPAAVDITAILTFTDVLAQGDAPSSAQAVATSVFCRRSDLPTDPDIDNPTLVVRGKVYRVDRNMLDEAGGITLLLRAVG